MSDYFLRGKPAANGLTHKGEGMALISCKECGLQVSDQAVSCPHCGHPMNQPPTLPAEPVHHTGVMTKPKRGASGCAVIILAGVIAIAVVTCMAGTSETTTSARPSSAVPAHSPAQMLQDASNENRSPSVRLASAQLLMKEHPGTDEAQAAAELIPSLEEQVRLEDLGKQWVYTSHEDAMTSQKSHHAEVRSTNIHEFEFPYHRPQRARLTLRDHPRYGKDVIFAIERGQLQCSSYSGCDVMVRFGDAPARRYSANGPEDSSSEMLFFENQADFRRRMQGVDVVRISTSIYKQGSPIWEFDVSGYNPERMK